MVDNREFFLLTEEKDFFKHCLNSLKIKPVFCKTERELIEKIYSEVPQAIVIDLDLTSNISPRELIVSIKNIPFLLETSIIGVCSKKTLEKLDFQDLPLDDFLVKPLEELITIKLFELIQYRSQRTLDANPLTKLPGNTSIIYKIQSLIKEKKDFALGYVDLNNFKAYNDKYGFLRGDDVIKVLARLLVNLVNQIPGETFVGHVGGDDFVFIVPPQYAEKLAQDIIAFFDDIIPSFYDEEDKKARKIISKDRQGNVKEFPVMSVSIAIVINSKKRRFKHYGEVAKVAAEVKKFVKQNREKSAYLIDRRQSQ